MMRNSGRFVQSDEFPTMNVWSVLDRTLKILMADSSRNGDLEPLRRFRGSKQSLQEHRMLHFKR
jgi:hypothetical protein